MVVENAGFGAQNAAPIARRLFDFVIQGLYPAEEDILAVQRGQATRPIGKQREVASMPWPPRPAMSKEELPTDAKALSSPSVAHRSSPMGARTPSANTAEASAGVRVAQRVSE
jgi:penicillin-binding protein 2